MMNSISFISFTLAHKATEDDSGKLELAWGGATLQYT